MRSFPEILAKKSELEREYREALEGFVFGPDWELELHKRKAKLQACKDLLQALWLMPVPFE